MDLEDKHINNDCISNGKNENTNDTDDCAENIELPVIKDESDTIAINAVRKNDISCDKLEYKNYNLREIKRSVVKYESDDHKIVPKKRKSKRILNEYDMAEHSNKRNRSTEYTCHLCRDTFDTNNDLLDHKRTHANEDNIFMCKRCKKAFSDHRAYINHRLNHLKTSPYNCYECNRQFKKKRSLKAHIYMHYNIVSVCPVCKINIPHKHLYNHIQSHSHRECVECGKRVKVTNYNYHMTVHSGFKKYQCWYCGQGFFNNNQRVVHTRIHTGERPYQCKVCQRTFIQQTDLKVHERTHNPNIIMYECDHCGKRYNLKRSLITHMRIHSNYKPYKCTLCTEKFHTSTYLSLHTLKVHVKNNLYRCSYCDMDFKYKGVYNRHLLCKQHLQRVISVTRQKTLNN